MLKHIPGLINARQRLNSTRKQNGTLWISAHSVDPNILTAFSAIGNPVEDLFAGLFVSDLTSYCSFQAHFVLRYLPHRCKALEIGPGLFLEKFARMFLKHSFLYYLPHNLNLSFLYHVVDSLLCNSTSDLFVLNHILLYELQMCRHQLKNLLLLCKTTG